MIDLKIGIISGILHPKYGGPSTVVLAHTKGLSSYTQAEVFGVVQTNEAEEVRKLFPQVYLSPGAFPRRWFYGQGLKKTLEKAAAHLDVLHAHMLWDYPVYAAWQASKKVCKPLIITPHGCVSSPWRYKSLHKRIYRRVILDRILNDTSCLHVLNNEEELACRKFRVKCPIRVIPNGIPLAEYERVRDPAPVYEHWPQLRDKRVLLYMGRLWAGKGLDILPEAWAETLKKSTDASDWLLVMAGPDYRNYKTILLSQINALGIEKHVLVTGMVNGKIKDALFEIAEGFVLPSHSEGFSMALLEAIAAGLPALFTTGCHFPELAKAGGGWEIPVKKNALVKALLEITSLTPNSLKRIGQKGWALGKERFTSEYVIHELISMYKTFCK